VSVDDRAAPSSIPVALWEATIEMPSATRHAVRSIFAQYDSLLAELSRHREVLQARDALQAALDDPAFLHWLGSQDVIDISPALARAVSAIHRLRAALRGGGGDTEDNQ
jgi:hypothetical protein